MDHHFPLPIWSGPRTTVDRYSSAATLRTVRTKSAALLAATSVALLSACTNLSSSNLASTEHNFERRPYVGAGALISQLDPGVQQFDDLSINEDQGFGASLALGYDITSRVAVEGHFASLGEASLDPEGDISYQVGGLTALVYGINEPRERARREGLSFFGRAGLGTLKTDSDLPVERVNDIHLVLGAGVEYGLANGLAGRLELVSHDSDAAFGQLGLVYRFGAIGGNARRSSAQSENAATTAEPAAMAVEAPTEEVAVEEEAQDVFPEADLGIATEDIATEDNDVPVETIETDANALQSPNRGRAASAQTGLLIEPLDRATGATTSSATESAAEGLVITRKLVDQDSDGVGDDADACPGTTEGSPVDVRGCDLFDGVVDGVTFQIASNRLTDSALAVLVEVARTLERYPDIRVSIDAHTDDRGDAQSNLLLSRRRALEVARFLVAQGIAGNRLMPNAYGEERPVDSNQTSEGRRRNRRVEFRILE